MSLPLEMRERALGVWGGRITLRVKTAGRGAPLVYLHPASGLQFDPFLASLSTSTASTHRKSRARALVIRMRFTTSTACRIWC